MSVPVLSEREESVLDLFKQFCLASQSEDDRMDLEEQDWFALSLGYFLAFGLPVPDAFRLAGVARYTYKYWECV